MQRPPVVVAAVVAFVVMEVVVAVGVVAVVVVGIVEVALVPGLFKIKISSFLCGYRCRSVSFRR